MQEIFAEIKTAVVAGRHKDIEALVANALRQGCGSDDLINTALIAAMDEVGRRFGRGEIFVPEMLVSAMTMKKGLDLVKPLLQESGENSEPKGKVVLCTVRGDLHDIGKNLVAMMLEGAGFEVIDLGVDSTAAQVVDKVKELKPDVLGLSALLTTTMPEMQNVIATLAAENLRDTVRVMIGGAPVRAEFAEKIGADAYGQDAVEAVAITRRLIGR